MQSIDQKYTFDNLIVSNSNKKTIDTIKNMDTSANLFYIVGETATGKTHLLQAVANQLRDKNIIYVTSEGFITDFTRALEKHNLQEFRKKYIQCDILMIDDFQFISGKEYTQKELLHIIEELLNKNKKVIIASDRYLKAQVEQIKDYLLLELDYLDENSKIKLIKLKLKELECTLDDKDIKLLANNHKTVRVIEAKLCKIKAMQQVKYL
jgi:chromosomal replication initiator protein